MINLDFEQIRSQMTIKASKAGKIVKFEEENRIVLAVVRSGWEAYCKYVGLEHYRHFEGRVME